MTPSFDDITAFSSDQQHACFSIHADPQIFTPSPLATTFGANMSRPITFILVSLILVFGVCPRAGAEAQEEKANNLLDEIISTFNYSTRLNSKGEEGQKVKTYFQTKINENKDNLIHLASLFLFASR